MAPARWSAAGISTGNPFPIILQSGHIVGEGAFKVGFAPTVLARSRTAQIVVTYETDPFTQNTASVTQPLCGEGVRTGTRVLVTAGGVPLAVVDRIQLQRITGNRNKPIVSSVDVFQNAAVQTVAAPPACTSFHYHRE